MPSPLFFEVSRQTYTQVTGLFDFLWSTTAAMWNLRWQVDGFLRSYPDATGKELEHRFVLGSGIYGSNLRRTCIDHTWDQQQEEFAKFLLINIFAVYESWIKAVLEELGSYTRSNEKDLQFPTGTDAHGNKTGVWGVIDNITRNESIFLKSTFYDLLLLHDKNSTTNLDALMRCYRYFKECRNCFAHKGGIADDKTEDAYKDFLAVATTTDLKVKEVPMHEPIIKGKPVRVYLRGITGFCEVILKILTTIDAEFARSEKAEKEFLRRWKNAHVNSPTLTKRDISKRENKIRGLVRKLNLPGPTRVTELETWLISKRLIH